MEKRVVKAFRTAGTVRVTIPITIWRMMGKPTRFVIEVENGRIILTPIR